MNRTFPKTRLRRTRLQSYLRELTSETTLSAKDLIYPIFVMEGNTPVAPIPSMPGIRRLSIQESVKTAQHAAKLGIQAIALFPVVPEAYKDISGSNALDTDNLICKAIRAIKAAHIDIAIIADVALDPYTTHGHDGIVQHDNVDNDKTVALLCEQALTLAQAGADMIAPSDMQDGRIAAIRQKLDQHNFHNTIILSYAAKYASHFYGPFRDAVGSAKQLGQQGKHTYQQDYRNTDEAMHEIALDINEGADIIMIKPGMAYLDIIYRAKERFMMPTFAYQVSGEYAMIEALAQTSNTDRLQLHIECLYAFKRAGCDAIFSYAALDIANYLPIR